MTKRFKQNKNKVLLVIAVILIVLIILLIIGFIIYNKRIDESNKIKEQENKKTTISEVIDGLQEEILEVETKQEENVEETDKQETTNIKDITQIGGYKVIGRIKIDKIDLEDVILEKTTDKSLNLGLTKFWGPEMNEIGNFSITGHNYKISRSKLFSNLNKIVEEDTFSLQDLKNRTVTYKIYKKYTVDPKDTTAIDQNEDGKREVTLITCTKGAKSRIIFKAREI